jgi:DeoR/GlpR family transcriptional regulator of sugar metabolism
MLKKERHRFILTELSRQDKVISAALSAQLQTSEDTIRRDLHELSAAGLLVKVHGGALNLPPPPAQGEQQALALMREGLQMLLGSSGAQSVQVMVFSLTV